jgi:uncharacterized protein
MDPAIFSRIALELSLSESSIAAAAGLFEQGATAPFIARYRKEAIGGINAVKVHAIEERLVYYQDVLTRRAGLLNLAADQKRLTSDLQQWIEKAISKVELDDLGQCLKPRRKTRATEAQEKGLEPLADYLWNQEPDAWSLEEHADVFINADKQVPAREQALQGACDIIAEWISENLEIRSRLREMFWKDGVVVSTVVPAKASQKTKYTMYYNRREPAASIPSHRVLAIRRGSKEGVLTSAIECDSAKALELMVSMAIKDKESVFAPLLERTIRDSYSRILRPLIETQVRSMLKERADREAIRVFQDNLSNLLHTPPAGAMVVLGIDIGKGDEAKLAIVDPNGALLEETAIRLRAPKPAQAAAVKVRPAPAEADAPPQEAPPAAVAAQQEVPPAEPAEQSAAAVEAVPADVPVAGSTPEPEHSTPAAPEAAIDTAAAGAIPAEAETRAEPVAGAESQVPEAATEVPAEEATESKPPTEVAAEAPSVSVEPIPAAEPEPAPEAESGSDAAILTAPAEVSELAISAGAPEAAVEAAEQKTPAALQAAPDSFIEAARAILRDLISRHAIKAVAIGNSTAARNLEGLVRQILTDEKIENVLITAVNDAGVAIYSSSRIAREELPEQSVAARCAISLARRLQDPLSELVKVDPKLIGVGQYQHDVDQKELHRSLVQTVRYCVNHVGTDLNTAGFSLLRYVSGLNDKSARKIVMARAAKGVFPSRASLLEIPGIDAAAYAQAAGFLRIRKGENPLDGTAVHPESYPLVEKMAAALNVGVADLIGNRELTSGLKLEDFVTESAGLPTLHDIREELIRPGRDPRRTFKIAHFRADVKLLADLKEGMTLEGTVTNVTNFGAFVDVGVHQDGLVHLSQMSNRFIRDPREAVKVGDVVQVKVISVEMETKRIGLSIKALLPPPVRRRKKPRRKGAPDPGARGGPHRPAALAVAPSADGQTAVPDAGAAAPPATNPGPRRRESGRRDFHRPDSGGRAGRRPESARPEAGRHEGSGRGRDRDRRPDSRREERRPEKPVQPQAPAPPQPQVPEPTMQEKIAILQSKFRGIN